MANPLQLFDITAEQIETVVRIFYARVRQHPQLGPVFAAHIAAGDWPDHEDKIIRFWRNAILREGGYSGNPMRVHMETSSVQADHFPMWLALFDQVLEETLPSNTARSFSMLAHRIGDGFKFGLVQLRQPKGHAPVLR